MSWFYHFFFLPKKKPTKISGLCNGVMCHWMQPELIPLIILTKLYKNRYLLITRCYFKIFNHNLNSALWPILKRMEVKMNCIINKTCCNYFIIHIPFFQCRLFSTNLPHVHTCLKWKVPKNRFWLNRVFLMSLKSCKTFNISRWVFFVLCIIKLCSLHS